MCLGSAVAQEPGSRNNSLEGWLSQELALPITLGGQGSAVLCGAPRMPLAAWSRFIGGSVAAQMGYKLERETLPWIQNKASGVAFGKFGGMGTLIY